MADWSIETVNVARERPAGLHAALLGGEIAIARIVGAATEYRRAALAAISAATSTANVYGNTTLHTVGPYLARHLQDPADYFRRAGELDMVFVKAQSDPRPALRDAVANVLALDRVGRLAEPGLGPYADAVVRLHGAGAANPLHNDMLARDAAQTRLSVAAARHQLSAIFCLQECDRGGELIHYRRKWRPADEAWKVAGGLGYRSEVVAGADAATFKPAAGDLYLIDPRHYHEIRRVEGRTRITLGFFTLFFDPVPRTGWCLA